MLNSVMGVPDQIPIKHYRDRESVARKIIAKGNIITRTDRVLHEHQR
jgi:hypothetical protein